VTIRHLSWRRIATLAFVLAVPAAAPASEGGFELSLSAERAEWRLGERIELRVSLVNVSGSSLEPETLDVSSRGVRLFVAPDRGELREYLGPRWGIGDGVDRLELPLRAGEETTAAVTLLWNHRVPTDHLSALYADRIRQQRLDEDVAIATPGRYWLKAVYAVAGELVESQPLAVDVVAPSAADLPIWERMRRDGELTYLVHTGELRWPAGSPEADAFAADVRRLLADNRGSAYGEEIERLLASFEATAR